VFITPIATATHSAGVEEQWKGACRVDLRAFHVDVSADVNAANCVAYVLMFHNSTTCAEAPTADWPMRLSATMWSWLHSRKRVFNRSKFVLVRVRVYQVPLHIINWWRPCCRLMTNGVPVDALPGRRNRRRIIPPSCGDRVSLLLLSPSWVDCPVLALWSPVPPEREEAGLTGAGRGQMEKLRSSSRLHRVRHAVSTVTAAMATGRVRGRRG
jgi:hypothetical protein